jgi:hypothetical protein
MTDVICALLLGACIGGLIVLYWMSPKKPLRDTFNDIHHSEDSLEQRARRVQ